MRFACRITKATHKHQNYVIFIAFAEQQCFEERPSVLRYVYIDCLITLLLSDGRAEEAWETCMGDATTAPPPQQ